MKYTEDLIKEFKENNKGRIITNCREEVIEIDPQRIIGINNTYEYPDILNDFKMKRLEESYGKSGWLNNHKSIVGFSLLMLPNGDLLVDGAGNHRAVFAKEKGLKSVKAIVRKIKTLKIVKR